MALTVSSRPVAVPPGLLGVPRLTAGSFPSHWPGRSRSRAVAARSPRRLCLVCGQWPLDAWSVPAHAGKTTDTAAARIVTAASATINVLAAITGRPRPDARSPLTTPSSVRTNVPHLLPTCDVPLRLAPAVAHTTCRESSSGSVDRTSVHRFTWLPKTSMPAQRSNPGRAVGTSPIRSTARAPQGCSGCAVRAVTGGRNGPDRGGRRLTIAAGRLHVVSTSARGPSVGKRPVEHTI